MDLRTRDALWTLLIMALGYEALDEGRQTVEVRRWVERSRAID